VFEAPKAKGRNRGVKRQKKKTRMTQKTCRKPQWEVRKKQPRGDRARSSMGGRERLKGGEMCKGGRGFSENGMQSKKKR